MDEKPAGTPSGIGVAVRPYARRIAAAVKARVRHYCRCARHSGAVFTPLGEVQRPVRESATALRVRATSGS